MWRRYLTRICGSLPLVVPVCATVLCCSHVRDFLSGVLRNARGGDATQDCTITKDTTLLSLMLKADNDTATAMCDQEIVDEMLMFFLAVRLRLGTHATALRSMTVTVRCYAMPGPRNYCQLAVMDHHAAVQASGRTSQDGGGGADCGGTGGHATHG